MCEVNAQDHPLLLLLHRGVFLDTPAPRVSASTGPTGPEAARAPRVVCLSRRGYFAELETPAKNPEMRVWLLSVYFSQSQHQRAALPTFSLNFLFPNGKKQPACRPTQPF